MFPLMYARVNIVLCDRGEMPHRKACALLSTPPQNGYILLWSQVYITLPLTNTYTVHDTVYTIIYA